MNGFWDLNWSMAGISVDFEMLFHDGHTTPESVASSDGNVWFSTADLESIIFSQRLRMAERTNNREVF